MRDHDNPSAARPGLRDSVSYECTSNTGAAVWCLNPKRQQRRHARRLADRFVQREREPPRIVHVDGHRASHDEREHTDHAQVRIIGDEDCARKPFDKPAGFVEFVDSRGHQAEGIGALFPRQYGHVTTLVQRKSRNRG